MKKNDLTATEFKIISMILLMVLINMAIIGTTEYFNIRIPFACLLALASCFICGFISLQGVRKWISDPYKALIEEAEQEAETSRLVLENLQNIANGRRLNKQIYNSSQVKVMQELEAIQGWLEKLATEKDADTLSMIQENISETVKLANDVENLKDQKNTLNVQLDEKNQELESLKTYLNIMEDNLNRLADNLAIQREALLNGNLFYRSEHSFNGRFGEIVEGTNKILDYYINLLENINSSVLIIDRDYNLKFTNLFALEYAAKRTSREHAIGAKCYDIFGCDMNACKAAECLLKDEKLSFVESGSGLDIAVDLIPYMDQDGTVRGIIEAFRDVSDIKHRERKVQKQLDYQDAEVEKLIRNLSLLEKGELGIEITESKGDEDTEQIANIFNQLNRSLIKSTNSIKMYIDEISDILSDIAEKNLTRTIERNYHGDFISLKDSINNIIEQYNFILSEFNSASGQVGIGAQQVACSSQNLSVGASEQTTAVEEIVATINEVAGQTKNNAMYSNKARGLSVKAKEDAQNGNQQMREMLIAMNDIKESSNSIAGVIKVIDDIAFQTNIPALNAAVEAAWAGQSGKGFAVVAEEVRSLASRSSEAARETTNLIDNSIKKVETGNKIVTDTATALDKIVIVVTEAAAITSKIAEASTQQAAAIEQINLSMSMISKVTQSNTAAAEESAASSEELAGQAEMLRNQIHEFQLKSEKMSLSRLQQNIGRY